jgi:hypothetical protein
MATEGWHPLMTPEARQDLPERASTPLVPKHEVQPKAGHWYVVVDAEGQRECGYCGSVERGLVWVVMGHWALLSIDSRCALWEVALTRDGEAETQQAA